MMKVAAVQFSPVFRKREENLKRLSKLVMEAASEGAQLIVLPELCSTGYSFMSAEEAREFAECPRWMDDDMAEGSAMSTFYNLARTLHICIVFGFVELDPGTQKLYNSQCYIDPDGYYESYRKINQWGQDFLWCSPGNGNPPIINSVLGKRIGLLICRDVRDKKDDAWSNFYSSGDADIVAFSANFGDGAFPANSWMDFATENRVHLVVSNRYGQELNNNFGEGGICVVHPDGKVDCKGLVWNQDCIIYSEIP